MYVLQPTICNFGVHLTAIEGCAALTHNSEICSCSFISLRIHVPAVSFLIDIDPQYAGIMHRRAGPNYDTHTLP